MGSRESLQLLQSLRFERIFWVQDSAHWNGCGIGDGVVSNSTCTVLVKLSVFARWQTNAGDGTSIKLNAALTSGLPFDKIWNQFHSPTSLHSISKVFFAIFSVCFAFKEFRYENCLWTCLPSPNYITSHVEELGFYTRLSTTGKLINIRGSTCEWWTWPPYFFVVICTFLERTRVWPLDELGFSAYWTARKDNKINE